MSLTLPGHVKKYSYLSSTVTGIFGSKRFLLFVSATEHKSCHCFFFFLPSSFVHFILAKNYWRKRSNKKSSTTTTATLDCWPTADNRRRLSITGEAETKGQTEREKDRKQSQACKTSLKMDPSTTRVLKKRACERRLWDARQNDAEWNWQFVWER